MAQTRSSNPFDQLHILKGNVPSVTEGRVLGHEGVGVVTEVGPGVSTSAPATESLMRAYDTFEHVATEAALKVNLKNESGG